ncbi:hypothetical protein ABIB49_001400 [Arthrobacter sp. UYCu512]
MPSLPALKTRKLPIGLLRFFAVFAVVGLLTTLWSVASPLISVPDEQSHVIKAASVVRGQLQGESGTAQGERSQVDVPAYIAATDGLPFCFAWKSLVSAGCSPPVTSDTTIVKALTSAGNYNPMYYAVTGLPSLFLSGAKAIYAMRIVSGLLSAAFIAIAMISLAGLRQWRLPLFVASFALTPMVLFLSGAVNPNALEIATSMSVFAALCLTWDRLQSNGAWKGPLGAATLSAVVLANTRAASLLWLALAVVASLMLFGYRPLLSLFRQKFGWAMIGIVAIGCALSLVWLRVANSLQNLMGQGIDATPTQIATIMLDRTFDFAVGYVSYLGWLDTPGPAGVLAVWATLIIGSIFISWSVADRAGRLTVAFLTVAVIALPPLLQIPLAKDVGLIWQGRYILALVVVLVTACGVAMRSFSVANAGVGRRASAAVLTLLVFGHFYSFIYGLRRYVIGLQDSSNWRDMVEAPQWQPPFGWITLAVLYLAVLVAAAILLHRWVTVKPPATAAAAHTGTAVEANGSQAPHHDPLPTPVATLET